MTKLCLQFQSLKPWKCLLSHGMIRVPQHCKTTSKKPVFLMRKKMATPTIHFLPETFHWAVLRWKFGSWRCHMWWYSDIRWRSSCNARNSNWRDDCFRNANSWIKCKRGREKGGRTGNRCVSFAMKLKKTAKYRKFVSASFRLIVKK